MDVPLSNPSSGWKWKPRSQSAAMATLKCTESPPRVFVIKWSLQGWGPWVWNYVPKPWKHLIRLWLLTLVYGMHAVYCWGACVLTVQEGRVIQPLTRKRAPWWEEKRQEPGRWWQWTGQVSNQRMWKLSCSMPWLQREPAGSCYLFLMSWLFCYDCFRARLQPRVAPPFHSAIKTTDSGHAKRSWY